MSEERNRFEASAAALGYLYQLSVALLVCVQKLPEGVDWSVAIEAGDDIETVDKEGTEWWQLKHRAQGTRLTDASSDLWKTLRIWATAVAEHQVELPETEFFLLTTGTASAGSVGRCLASRLSGQPRDEEKALQLLDEVRQHSQDKSTAAAANFKAWDELDQQQRLDLLRRIQVLENADDIVAIGEHLHRHAVWAVGRARAAAFRQRLEGWFFQRSITHLAGRSSDPITGSEFDSVFENFRNQLGNENLPIDADIVTLDVESTGHLDRVFVRQLEIAGIRGARIRRAVSDYVRAFTQRSKWVDENLLRPGELAAYERRLVDEWERQFDVMVDELGETAAEAERCAQARKIYGWVETAARFNIRPGCEEVFITTGSYQMLADDRRVGWHPDYAARLMSMLEPAVRR